MSFVEKCATAVKRAFGQERGYVPMSADMARDIGIGPSDLVEFAAQDRDVAPRMSRMQKVFGLAPNARPVDHWLNYDMVQACVHCAHKRQCDATLQGADVRPEDTEFCPNHANYRMLAEPRN